MKKVLTLAMLITLAACSKSKSTCQHVTSIWQVPEAAGVRNDTLYTNLLVCDNDLKDLQADNGRQYNYFVKKDNAVKHITVLNLFY